MGTKPGVELKTREISQLTPCGEETNMDLITKFTWDEAGAPAVEYAFLMSFIAVAIAASVTTFGAAIRDIFTLVSTKFPGGG
jgi:Flp pilus assembly pilin Flp